MAHCRAFDDDIKRVDNQDDVTGGDLKWAWWRNWKKPLVQKMTRSVKD